MGRKRPDPIRDSSLPADVIRLSDGRLAFNHQWPKTVWSRHPEYKGKTYRKALGTTDLKEAKIRAAKARVAFQLECDRLLAPSEAEREAAWLAGLSEVQRRQLL